MRSGVRRRVILATAVACSALALSPQRILPRLNSDRLQVTPLDLHFLTGKALSRLHDGSAVPFAFRLSVSTNQWATPALETSLARFIISYDLWAERFKVVQQFGGTRRAVANLTPSAAEAWCISQMGVSLANVPADKDLWMRLDIRAEDPMPRSPVSDAGFTLATLIDIFSQKARPEVQEWNAETAPFRLNNLRQ